jgi:hypothetical protein
VTLMDPVALVVEALTAAGHTRVHPDPTDQYETLGAEALGPPDDDTELWEYIWVQEVTGDTPHIRYSDRPAVQVILYSNDDGPRRARQVQVDLMNAQGVRFPSGGIHRVITAIRPYRQDISGLPPGVVRVSATYELVLSSYEKWV